MPHDAARQRRLQVPAGFGHHHRRRPARLRQRLVERLACSTARHMGGGCSTRLVQYPPAASSFSGAIAKGYERIERAS